MQKNLMHLSVSTFTGGEWNRLMSFVVDNVLAIASRITEALVLIGDEDQQGLHDHGARLADSASGVTYTVVVRGTRIIVGLHEFSNSDGSWGRPAGKLAIEHVDLVLREMIDNVLSGNSTELAIPLLNTTDVFGLIDKSWPSQEAFDANLEPTVEIRRLSTDEEDLYQELRDDELCRHLYPDLGDKQVHIVRPFFGPWEPDDIMWMNYCLPASQKALKAAA